MRCPSRHDFIPFRTIMTDMAALQHSAVMIDAVCPLGEPLPCTYCGDYPACFLAALLHGMAKGWRGREQGMSIEKMDMRVQSKGSSLAKIDKQVRL